MPSTNRERDWRIQDALESGLVGAPTQLPVAVDLRRPKWWLVGDQGSTGSCVGWATADSVLRWHFVEVARLGQNERLAPRFTWMAAKETDEFETRPTTFIDSDGTSLKAALDVSRKYGAVREQILPFMNGSLFAGTTETFYAMATAFKIASYFNLDGPDRLREWKIWLASCGPIVTRLDVDATWDRAKQTKGNLDGYQPNTARGGHAVAVVGYRADGRFIVRNSWGKTWGDKGYAYASPDYADAAFSESYGVKVI